MDMGTQGSGRKRLPNRERLSAEDDALNQIAREAEARLAAKRAARAEAREIRMKELERQQKEIYQVQKKYYGLDTKWGDIEQWMEDSERYSRRSRRNTSASDEDERMSVGSRGSLRAQPELEYASPYAWNNGYDGELYGSQSLSRRSGRNSSYSGGDGRFSALSSSREETLGLFSSDLGLPSSSLASKPLSFQNGTRPSLLCGTARPVGSYRASVWDESGLGGARRGSTCGSRAPSEYSGHLNSSSRASSRASSARASPVVEERPDKDFTEKGSRNMPSLSAATLASLGGTSSRRGSGDTSISMDTEASMREIKDSLAEVEEKYKKAMVSNAQLDNEKTNFVYQVDTLKDMLLELEEQLAESQRQYEEKNKEFEREKHAHSILQFQFAEVKEALRQREEMLEKHGIVLNSEIAANGEASDTLNNAGYQGPTKMTREELSALRSAGEGTLGKAKEVEVKNEMVENMGKREILQNTEQEQHKEDREVLHPGDNVEDQKTSEDNALSPGPLAEAQCKQQAQSHVLLENPGQDETSEAVDLPDSRSSTSLEQSSCLGELGSEAPGPVQGHGHCNALDSQNQEKENEDLNTDLSGIVPEPCLDSIPGQTPKVDKVSCTDLVGPGGNHTDNVAEAGRAAVGEQGDAVASSPLVHRYDMVSHDGRCVVNGLGPSTEQSPNREPTQEVSKPEETPEQSPQEDVEKDAGEDGDIEVRDNQPTEVGVQAVPGSPAAQSSQEDGTGPGRVDADSALLDMNEPTKDGNEQRAGSVGPSQKKTKNKKKKKKKKAPLEPLEEVRKESTCGDAEADEAQEESEMRLPERTQGTEAQHAARAPEQRVLSYSSGEANCPESPKPQLEGKLNQEDDPVKTQVGRVTADRGTLMSAGDTLQSSDSTKDKESDEHVTEGHTDGLAQNSPLEFECEKGNHDSLLEKKSPPKDIGDVSKIESTEGPMSHHPGQTAEKALDSLDLENGLSAPAGGPGDLSSESRGQAGAGSEKGRSKEDCTMS